MFCTECGYEYGLNETVCQNCGVPLGKRESNQKRNKKKKLILIAIISLIVTIGIVIGITTMPSRAVVGDWKAIGLHDEEDGFTAVPSSYSTKFIANFTNDNRFILSIDGSDVKGTWKYQESDEEKRDPTQQGKGRSLLLYARGREIFFGMQKPTA